MQSVVVHGAFDFRSPYLLQKTKKFSYYAGLAELTKHLPIATKRLSKWRVVLSSSGCGA